MTAEESSAKMSDTAARSASYEAVEILGKGTFGEVVKCWKRSTGEMVAVKVLRGCDKLMIENELQLLNSLKGIDADKCHIIKFYECFHDDYAVYLSFELLEQSLYEYQRKNNFISLPVMHIRTITLQILKALSKLEELSIMHTDVKPENIMIVNQESYPFQVKLIDFGSASLLNQMHSVKEPYIQTRFYRSPEILLGLPFNEKIDMWSLGCVIAELWLGFPLYPASNEYDQIRYICETQGLPGNHLLSAASKAKLFFKQVTEHNASPDWQLKSVTEYENETGMMPLETRKYILRSLDDIETVKQTNIEIPHCDRLPESRDRKSMVELLKMMLLLDSSNRISPNAALKHPFITMKLLRTFPEYQNTYYFQLSVESLKNALKYEWNAENESLFHPVDCLSVEFRCYTNEKAPGMLQVTAEERIIDKHVTQYDKKHFSSPQQEVSARAFRKQSVEGSAKWADEAGGMHSEALSHVQGSALTEEEVFPTVEENLQPEHNKACKEILNPTDPKRQELGEEVSNDLRRPSKALRQNGQRTFQQALLPLQQLRGQKGHQHEFNYGQIIQCPENHQLFVGNLPYYVTEKDLKTSFIGFGNVIDVHINRKGEKRGLPNFGFITFDNSEPVQNILNDKPVIYHGGMRLNIQTKKTRVACASEPQGEDDHMDIQENGRSPGGLNGVTSGETFQDCDERGQPPREGVAQEPCSGTRNGPRE
ncbi:homeodomain-interacting protein kinase 4-like [Protopterus annectens]|uniref:homeodomain-interacting protein kinase 4-like n=1 Tax=Protopterus annectens TaxID=7888 RepID=UPI001CF969A5|nr:homeodomain-interacting protein kinase 4-like [Protopterus annectens]